MCEALFHVILINIAKIRSIFFISMSNWAEKIYSKKILVILLEYYRLIPIQKHMNHSILDSEVKFVRVFILHATKVEKTYESSLCYQF